MNAMLERSFVVKCKEIGYRNVRQVASLNSCCDWMGGIMMPGCGRDVRHGLVAEVKLDVIVGRSGP